MGLGSKGLDRRVLGFGLEAQGVQEETFSKSEFLTALCQLSTSRSPPMIPNEFGFSRKTLPPIKRTNTHGKPPGACLAAAYLLLRPETNTETSNPFPQ